MLGGDIEQLVLSGALFNGEGRSSSPPRSPSPDHDSWPASDIDDEEYDSDAERYAALEKSLGPDRHLAPQGMPPGRTGVKGVIRDRNEAREIERGKRKQDVREMNKAMEKMMVGGKTALEEEREKDWEKMVAEGLDPAMMGLGEAAPFGELGGKGRGKFGHLREVGIKGFVDALEKDTRGVWVVVHLYDPSLDRCYDLDTILARLARTHTDTKFIRTRAGALGFATRPSTTRKTQKQSKKSSITQSSRRPIDDDEDDPYEYNAPEAHISEEDEDEGVGSEDDDVEVDVDVLPTLLVYRDGDLVHNWVRVDWEAGPEGVEDLLFKHHILKSYGIATGGNCGLSSDDEDLLDFETDPNANL